MSPENRPCAVRRITDGPFHHFFGYDDKYPCDLSGRYLLAMRVAFMRRSPTPQDIAVLGLVDPANDCRWHPLAETVAWYWQQGTMLQWMPSAPDREITYNTRRREGFGSVVLDVVTGASRSLPRPVYALSPDGRSAVSLNYARLHRTRPGYGYM
jgi:hypothetical protein